METSADATDRIREDKQEIPSLYPSLDMAQVQQPYSYDQMNNPQSNSADPYASEHLDNHYATANATAANDNQYATASTTKNPDEDVDFEGKPYETGEGEITTDTSNNLSPNSLAPTAPSLEKQQTLMAPSANHNRPVIENPKTSDDFYGYTADPVLKQICYGKKFALRNHKEKKITKFEVRVDDQAFMLLQGSEKDQMLNGFSLKVLSLGIVKTRFSFALSDNMGTKVIEASRGIGASTFIDLNFHYYGEKVKCGYIQPTGFNLNRISYNIYDVNRRHLFTFQSGMLRGLFSDGYSLVTPNKKETLAKFARNGDVIFEGRGLEPGQVDMKQKLLVLAAGMIMQMHI